MASDVSSPKNHRGVAMFIVLGVVIFFTMLGFMGLEMASKDSQVSGNLVDIKTKEEAAWGGLNLALGVMQAHPQSAVNQLQKFIADSSNTTKHEWLAFAADTVSLETAPSSPRFYPLGSGADKSGVLVRLVSLDIGGASGIPTGGGVVLTLKSTGQGRNGDQLTIIATYRMLGVDIPVQTTAASASSPSFALWLNGSLTSGNLGTNIDGGVYTSGSISLNQFPMHVHGKLIVNGDFITNDTFEVDSNVVIKGNLALQSHGTIFHSNAVIGDIYTATAGSTTASAPFSMPLTVDSTLILRQTGHHPSGTASFQSNGRLSVGLDFVAATADPFKTNTTTSAVTVGRNAWFKSFDGSSSGFKVGVITTANPGGTGNLEISGASITGCNLPNGAIIQGNLAARQTASQITFLGAGTVGGALYTKNSISAGGNFTVGQSLLARQGITGTGGSAFSVGGDLLLDYPILNYPSGPPAFSSSVKPSTSGNLVINGGNIPNGFSGWGVPAGKFFRYNTSGTNPTSVSTVGGATPCPQTTDTILPSDATIVGAAPTVPDPILNLHYSAQELAADTVGNAPDTINFSNTLTPGPYGAMKDLTNSLCSDAGATCDIWHIDGGSMNALYSYFQSHNLLYNGSGLGNTGFMILRLGNLDGNFSVDAGAAFVGKAMFVVDQPINVNGNWPISSDVDCIQLIDVRAPYGALGNWGFPAGGVGFWGYVYFETTPSSAPWNSGKFDGSTTQQLNGAMEFRGLNSSWIPNTGNLRISLKPSVFNAFRQYLPGVFCAASNGGASVSAISRSTKTLTVRGPASSVQFVRIGEYR